MHFLALLFPRSSLSVEKKVKALMVSNSTKLGLHYKQDCAHTPEFMHHRLRNQSPAAAVEYLGQLACSISEEQLY